MRYYNEQLQELQQQVARKAHLEAMLDELRMQRFELNSKVNQLEEAKEMEQADVDRLEGRSLAAFFYSVVGKKDEKLDKERQEAYAAAVKYDAAVCERDAVKEDMKRCEDELTPLYGCEERYAQMLKEKADTIKASKVPEADKILQLEEQIANLENQKKEIKEAVLAGKKANSKADEVLSELDDAESWGTWDVFGGGVISDYAKHSALDSAQEKVEQLQVQLRRFKTELADVTIHADLQVNIEGFLRFADYFFDGLFTDLTVLDRIRESQSQVQKTKEQIENVLNKLSLMRQNAEKKQAQIKTELDELIVKTEL